MSHCSIEESPAIRPRRVSFEWDRTPLHWIPGDPFASHLINVLHMLLPAGERWFVNVFLEALPLIHDERLRAQVRGFMGQEATHARAHTAFLEHLRRQGIDTTDYTRWIEWLCERVFAEERAPRFLRRRWLELRLAIIAAIEHFTCVMGSWVLDARALDEAGADRAMLELLRWHGAEEVEHRSVAFDVLEHVAGPRRYRLRVEGLAITFPGLYVAWRIGVRYLTTRDPTLSGSSFDTRDYLRSARAGRAPGIELLRAIPRYLRRRHHPSQEGSTGRALEHLAGGAMAALPV